VSLVLAQLLGGAEDLHLYIGRPRKSNPKEGGFSPTLKFLRGCDCLSRLTVIEGYWLERLLPHLIPDHCSGDPEDAQMPVPSLQSIVFLESWLFPQRCALLKDTLLRRQASGSSSLSIVLGNRTYILEHCYQDLSEAINIDACGLMRIQPGDKREETMASLATEKSQR
jgi:hypothetical protein